jgi:glucosamine--fructose-6-phosphate aminotransferase (isomerizing)
LTVAGFTEHDTFRSNQIREGHISRTEALRLLPQDNQVRMDALTEYAGLVGFDLDNAMRLIDAMPKLY